MTYGWAKKVSLTVYADYSQMCNGHSCLTSAKSQRHRYRHCWNHCGR